MVNKLQQPKKRGVGRPREYFDDADRPKRKFKSIQITPEFTALLKAGKQVYRQQNRRDGDDAKVIRAALEYYARLSAEQPERESAESKPDSDQSEF